METLLFTALAFVLGSLPLSWWLGRAVLHVDVRDFHEDRNPGAGNVWRAGGWRLGVVAAVLDVGKATLAVGLARWAGVADWALLPVAVAPILGHAFTPFLGLRGGKGVATTFGSWIGLFGPLGGLALAVCFALFYLVQRTDAWTDVLGTLLFATLLFVFGAAHVWVAIALADGVVLAWTNRHELRVLPQLRWRPQLARRHP
jgi:acyl phosphate:glycerol-3-phosphate acyltransferase